MGCFAYCAQCAFDRLRAMRFGDFGIECAYGAIYAKSIVGPGAGCAGKILAMLCVRRASAANMERSFGRNGLSLDAFVVVKRSEGRAGGSAVSMHLDVGRWNATST